MNNELNQSEEIVLAIVNKHQEVVASQIVDETGISPRTIQRALKKLVDLEYVLAIGTTKSRRYKRIYKRDEAPYNYVVFNSGERAGVLAFGNGEYTFKYDKSYKGELFEGLTKDKDNKSPELFQFFENLIPEYKRREKLLRDKDDLAELLLDLNNSHGSLDFITLDQVHKYHSDYGNRKNWLEVKHKILGDNDFPNLLEFDIDISDDILNSESNTEHSDLSGFQTKVDVDIDFDKGIVYESKMAKYLLKPRNKSKHNYFNADEDGKKRYFPYIAVNEHLFMTFAKNELGFNVPYTGIIKSKDVDFHYITKRYDRYDRFKYGQKDFAQVLNVSSDNKYKSDSQTLFEAINKTLMDKKHKLEALKFYYYSYLIKHSDLHLKNIAALNIGNKKFILSPLYDLISVGVYQGDSYDLAMGMKTPYKKPKNWSIDDFYALAKLIDVSESSFKQEARKITLTFITRMPVYIDRLKQFEVNEPLLLQQTRNSHDSVMLSERINNIFQEKIIQLKKHGLIQELGLVEEAGGLLNAQMKKKS